MLESHSIGSIVRAADGEPVAEAWVRLVEDGSLAVTGLDGRFRFDQVTSGTYSVTARAPDGREGSIELTVPGRIPDVVLAKAARAAKS